MKFLIFPEKIGFPAEAESVTVLSTRIMHTSAGSEKRTIHGVFGVLVRLGRVDEAASAISYSEDDAILGKIAECRDRKAGGLTIRITPGKAVWYARRRELT